MYAEVTEKRPLTTPDAARARVGERNRHRPRRLLLLQTTLRLIADEGIDAVTHRSVAEAAGVSLGSTTYWFASRQDMLRQALEYFARLEIEGLHERLAPIRGRRLSDRRLVDEFAELLLPQLDRERWRTVAQYAFMQEAARRPELEAICREWSQAWEDELAELFASLGTPSPRLEATMFLAMLDGLLLGQLAAPEDDVEHGVLRPALEAWFERLPRGGA
ncbi:MAG TPA: TetR family transcriptional regulator C-terminal domain-containing protein [Solirubrobacterales bacterium]|nr:TetR family transcriptional regulator C-terminal domain-containing protein [Solirubrobacterales bacterium]